MNNRKIEIRLHKNDSGEFYLDLNDFRDLIDIKKVRYYEIITQEDQKTLKIKLFDENKQLIKLI